MILTYFLAIILSVIYGLAYADEVDPGAAQPAEKKPEVFYCPAISALRKDPATHTWSALGGWKSYDMSFVDKITHFSGAQWRGTNVGQVFCVYRGDIATEFPILLAYRVLAYAPQGGRWSTDLGGYENCETPNQEECPFTIRLQQQFEDVYEQAEKLKQPTSRTSRVGF